MNIFTTFVHKARVLHIVFVVLLALMIAFGAYGLAFATIEGGEYPNNPFVTFCHKDDNLGDNDPFDPMSLSALDVFEGNHVNHGVHDIVPPFDWDFGYGDSGSHLGTNWEGAASQQFIDDGCVAPEVDDGVATIIAHKIVCTDESELPNWGTGGPDIDASTAEDWVDEYDSCEFESGWEFEWITAEDRFDAGDTFAGPAGSSWTTFGPTDGGGMTMTELTAEDIDGNEDIWFREVLQSGYIQFSHEADPDNSNDVTAEVYCSIDVLNYDNYERIDDIALDETFYCVAWNVLEEEPEPEPQECLVEGYKYNESGAPLSGWVIGLAGHVYDEQTLLADDVADDDGGSLTIIGIDETDGDGYYCIPESDEEIEVESSYIVYEELQEGWSPLKVVVDDSEESFFSDSFFDVFVDVSLDHGLTVDFYNRQEGSDVCLNIDGMQSEVPQGYHLEDEGRCVEDTSSTGGRTGGGSKIELTEGGGSPEPEPEVLGAADVACGMYLFDYMRKSFTNDPFEVTKLQAFLTSQGFFTPLTGIFNDVTDNSVHAYQNAHISDIVGPWVDAGIMNELHSTGYVYQTTRWFINNEVCPGSESFPAPLI